MIFDEFRVDPAYDRERRLELLNEEYRRQLAFHVEDGQRHHELLLQIAGWCMGKCRYCKHETPPEGRRTANRCQYLTPKIRREGGCEKWEWEVFDAISQGMPGVSESVSVESL